MSRTSRLPPDAAVQAVRIMCGEMTSQTLHIAAALTSAAESARDVLAPIADDNPVAAQAFQILCDALAEANPPEAIA